MPPVQYDQALTGTITPSGAMGYMVLKSMVATLRPVGAVGKGLFLAAMNTLAGSVGAITGSMGAKYLIPFIRGLVGFTQKPRGSTTAPDQRLPNEAKSVILIGEPVSTVVAPDMHTPADAEVTVDPRSRRS